MTLCPLPRRDLEVLVSNDGLVVYSSTTGLVHYLNAAASIVFSLCDGTRTSAEICEALGEAFDLVDPPVAEVTELIAELRELDLLEPDSAEQRSELA